MKRIAAVGGTTYSWTNRKGEQKQLELQADQYFMLGDNPDHSSDSRDFGAVNANAIIAEARFIIVSVAAGWVVRDDRTLKVLDNGQ